MSFNALRIPNYFFECSAGKAGVKDRMLRFRAVLVLLCAGLLSCSGDQVGGALDRVLPDPRDFIFGAVASDEPAATIAARQALMEGGTAADAAVALYFTLAVTAPSVASIGGGGVCLVHNPLSGKVETLDFIAPAARNAAGAGRPTAIPTAVRGMAALHGRYGRLPWPALLAQAEQLTRSGQTVMQRLASDLRSEAGRILADDATRDVFADKSGAPLRIGDPVRQVELGSVIGQIRGRGAGAFYTGPLAARIVEGIRLAGGTLSAEELRDYLPQWRPAVSAYFGRDQVHVGGPPATSGLVAAQIWQLLATDGRYGKAAAEERPHLLIEAARRAIAEADRWPAIANGDATEIAARNLSAERARELLAGHDAGSGPAAGSYGGSGAALRATTGSGFTVVDGSGMAVSCMVTLYDLFGIGRLAPGIGFFPARAPLPGLPGPSLLGPVMVTRPADRTFHFGVAGAGGLMGAVAATQLAARALLEKVPLGKAMAAGRFFPDGPSTSVLVDVDENDPAMSALVRLGYLVQRGQALGRLNAVLCPAGLPADSVKRSDCDAATDTRGGGLSRVFLIERD